MKAYVYPLDRQIDAHRMICALLNEREGAVVIDYGASPNLDATAYFDAFGIRTGNCGFIAPSPLPAELSLSIDHVRRRARYTIRPDHTRGPYAFAPPAAMCPNHTSRQWTSGLRAYLCIVPGTRDRIRSMTSEEIAERYRQAAELRAHLARA